MKPYARILLILTLLPLFGHSQKGYPYQAIIKGDTVAVLHIKQVRQLNIYFSRWDECKELSDSARQRSFTLEEIIEKQKAKETELQGKITALEAIRKEHESIKTHLEKDIRKEKTKRNILIIAAGVLGGLIIAK